MGREEGQKPHPENQPITRHDRRLAARSKKPLGSKRSPDSFLKGHVKAITISGAAALAAACITGAVIFDQGKNIPSIPQLGISRSGQESPVTLDFDENVFTQEIAKKNIKENPKEKQLWEEAYQKPPSKIVFDETMRNDALFLFEDALNRMEISDNQDFVDASKKIKSLKTAKRLLFGLNDDLKTPADSAYTFYEPEQKDYFALRVNPHSILNISGLELALILTHEGKHLKNMSNYIESLSPNLPPQEKVRLHTQRKAQENLLEEARGYGTASRAYIQAYGHLGDKGLVHDISPEYKMDAYFFILTGNNPNGDAWRRYVNVNIPSTRR